VPFPDVVTPIMMAELMQLEVSLSATQAAVFNDPASIFRSSDAPARGKTASIARRVAAVVDQDELSSPTVATACSALLRFPTRGGKRSPAYQNAIRREDSVIGGPIHFGRISPSAPLTAPRADDPPGSLSALPIQTSTPLSSPSRKSRTYGLSARSSVLGAKRIQASK
jgi:hypothetical protein